MTVTVFEYLIVLADISTILVFCLSLVLVPIEKLFQTLKTLFEHLSKHLKNCQKYSATSVVFQLPSPW